MWPKGISSNPERIRYGFIRWVPTRVALSMHECMLQKYTRQQLQAALNASDELLGKLTHRS